jgi:hypothetical protein
MEIGVEYYLPLADDINRCYNCNIEQKGSHKQYRHPDGRCATIHFHPGRDLSPILLRQIAKDIGYTVEELLADK